MLLGSQMFCCGMGTSVDYCLQMQLLSLPMGGEWEILSLVLHEELLMVREVVLDYICLFWTATTRNYPLFHGVSNWDLEMLSKFFSSGMLSELGVQNDPAFLPKRYGLFRNFAIYFFFRYFRKVPQILFLDGFSVAHKNMHTSTNHCTVRMLMPSYIGTQQNFSIYNIRSMGIDRYLV